MIEPFIIISNHAIKRRNHYTPIDKNVLIELVQKLNNKYFLFCRENNIYKIAFRGSNAIIKKNNNTLLLITAFGFDRINYKIETKKFKISIAK